MTISKQIYGIGLDDGETERFYSSTNGNPEIGDASVLTRDNAARNASEIAESVRHIFIDPNAELEFVIGHSAPKATIDTIRDLFPDGIILTHEAT